MPAGGPPGAPAGGGGGHHAGSQDCTPPAASFRRRRLARRPGYMRSEAGPRIRFLPATVGTPFRAQGGAGTQESHHSTSRPGGCGLDPGGQWQSTVPRSTAASALTCVSHPGLALTSGTGGSGLFGVQFRAGTKLPDRRTRLCGPGDAGCQGELPLMDSSHRDAACGERAGGSGTKGCPAPGEAPGSSCSLGSSPEAPSAPADSQAAFTSSFSFLQLSLSSAGERGEAEGCPPSREAEDTGAKAVSLDRPGEAPRLPSPCCNVQAAQGPADSAQAAEGSPRLQRATPSVWDTDAASSGSPDPSGLEADALRWDMLLRKCEPVLLECLLTNRRQLEVKSLRLKLEQLQEKAVEDDDYDKAETLAQRLEDLEKEQCGLHFRLPSRQPALSSLLVRLGTQAEAALLRATQQVDDDDTQALLRMEPRTLGPRAQDDMHVSITRRDWLLQEKQQLQKEIEALQVRMSVLEAQDQQLRREIEARERLLPWQGRDLAPLVGRLSLEELREVSQALRDTLALANQIPLWAGPPEAIRSLQERIKPLNLSVKEITTKVCVTGRLCSILRKKVNEIETQLPALLEAKMLAVSGNHFCTAKELTEEIGSLTSEREGLEGLLTMLGVLSSRDAARLRSMNDDYSRLRRELDHGTAAYEAGVKENTVKYMEVLEEKLCSCQCPLLEKVWEADLEACRLLIQSLQFQEAGGHTSTEDEGPVDDLGGASCTAAPAIASGPDSGDERMTPPQALEEGKAHLDPCPHCPASEQEPYMLSAELGEKCDAIGKKLFHLEDQLHTAIRSHDDDLIQSLRRELQMVKETLQAMILQLQPAKEAGGGEAAASWVTAGVREAQTWGVTGRGKEGL